jgi:4-hydroxybenzoate polyprenyltransferase
VCGGFFRSYPARVTHAPATTAPGAAARSGLDVLRVVASDIKLAHSVFALPFAVLGAFMAWSGGYPGTRGFILQLALIIPCMVFARTWAMLFNRIADRRFDAENPRTARRALASGRLSLGQAWAAALLAAGAFVAAASLFYVLFGNPWPGLLSIPVLAWIAFYSLTKRFTWLCHLFLGGALAASPIAAAIAVNPSTVLPPWPIPAVPAIYLLAGMVLFWVAGFDVIYAMQDIDFDRARGLSSIPARLGWRGAAWTSRVLHVLAFLMLVGAWLAHGQFGWIFGAAVAMVGGLLVFEHIVLFRRGRAGLQMAFFTVNGVVSCILGVAGCLDVVLN